MNSAKMCIFTAAVFIILQIGLFFTHTQKPVVYSPDTTLKQFARQNSIEQGKLKAELGITSGMGKKTLAGSGISKDKAEHLVAHLRGDFSGPTMVLMHLVAAAVIICALVLLTRNSMTAPWKYALLVIAVVCFGFVMGKSFNPMVNMVKVFKAAAGIEENLIGRLLMLAIFILFSLVGTKAVCGWACPYGALQELIYKLPFFSRVKKRVKIPFFLTNSIRAGLFILFVAALFFGLFGMAGKGRVIYHFINPFNLFEFNFPLLSITLYIGATLILGFLFYRPHCYLVCPFGLLSWILERASIFRIRIDPATCTQCKACVKACPGPAMKGLYEKRMLPADCFSCGECLKACTFGALAYAAKPKKSVRLPSAKQ